MAAVYCHFWLYLRFDNSILSDREGHDARGLWHYICTHNFWYTILSIIDDSMMFTKTWYIQRLPVIIYQVTMSIVLTIGICDAVLESFD